MYERGLLLSFLDISPDLSVSLVGKAWWTGGGGHTDHEYIGFKVEVAHPSCLPAPVQWLSPAFQEERVSRGGKKNLNGENFSTREPKWLMVISVPALQHLEVHGVCSCQDSGPESEGSESEGPGHHWLSLLPTAVWRPTAQASDPAQVPHRVSDQGLVPMTPNPPYCRSFSRSFWVFYPGSITNIAPLTEISSLRVQLQGLQGWALGFNHTEAQRDILIQYEGGEKGCEERSLPITELYLHNILAFVMYIQEQ